MSGRTPGVLDAKGLCSVACGLKGIYFFDDFRPEELWNSSEGLN